jgi:hypothetical protein
MSRKNKPLALRARIASIRATRWIVNRKNRGYGKVGKYLKKSGDEGSDRARKSGAVMSKVGILFFCSLLTIHCSQLYAQTDFNQLPDGSSGNALSQFTVCDDGTTTRRCTNQSVSNLILSSSQPGAFSSLIINYQSSAPASPTDQWLYAFDLTRYVPGSQTFSLVTDSADSHLSFVHGSPDTITQSGGTSFVTLGFLPGMLYTATGTTHNNLSGQIVSVTSGTITLASNNALTNESPTSTTLKGAFATIFQYCAHCNAGAGVYTPVLDAGGNAYFANVAIAPNTSTSGDAACLGGTGVSQLSDCGVAPTSATAALAAAKGITHTVCSTDSAPASGRLFPIWRAPVAATITGAHYLLIGATSIAGQIQICNGNGASCGNTQTSDVTASAGTDSDNGTLTSTAVAAGAYVNMHETTLSGSSPTSYTACIDYTVN